MSSQVKYMAIAEALEGLIASEKFPPGSRLPVEQVLADQHGVSRPTVRKAYKVLIDQGLVELVPTGGYFVRAITYRRWALTAHGAYADPWASLASKEGDRRAEITVSLVPPGMTVQRQPLADWFQFKADESDEFVARQAVRTLNGSPVMCATAFIPLGMCAGTDLHRPESISADSDGVVSALTNAVGAIVCHDHVTIRLATDHEASMLEVVQPLPVIEVVRLVSSDTGQVLVLERLVVEGAGAEIYSQIGVAA